MYDIANEEAANEELAYQNEFLSEFVGELCMWEEYDDNRTFQELSNWFAQACMEHEIQAHDAINIFKSFWSIGLRTALYNEIQDHKRKIRERYKTATEWFETKFPNGLGHLHPETGEYIGVNIITKQFIKEFLEAYEDQNSSSK